MSEAQLAHVADLLRERNALDEQIAALTGRPMTAGHLGEWIAATIFDIELEHSAVTAALDGRFRRGTLAGRTVNIKWYLKREGLLDIATSGPVDHYLVLTGPKGPSGSSRGLTRPWRIDEVYLFDAPEVVASLRRRGAKIGVASSVPAEEWRRAQVYPMSNVFGFPLTAVQMAQLRLFGGR